MNIRHIFFAIIFSFALASCANGPSAPVQPEEKNSSPALVETVADGVKFRLFADDSLAVGYNKISLTFADAASGKEIFPSSVALTPMMYMTGMSHSSPCEAAKFSSGKYQSGVMFTMPGGEAGSWRLNIEARISDGRTVKCEMPVSVKDSPLCKVFFSDAAGKAYVVSMLKKNFSVGLNEVEFVVSAKEDEKFSPAENLEIAMTPEMVAMNHSSPNNSDPVHISGGHYTGKVNFTMTGEWRINLVLMRNGASVGETFFDIVL